MWMKWDFFFFFTYIEIINKEPNRVFPEFLVVRIWCLHCYAWGSIPDQETDLQTVPWGKQKKRKKKKEPNRKKIKKNWAEILQFKITLNEM